MYRDAGFVEPGTEEVEVREVDEGLHLMTTGTQAACQFDQLALCAAGAEMVDDAQDLAHGIGEPPRAGRGEAPAF